MLAELFIKKPQICSIAQLQSTIFQCFVLTRTFVFVHYPLSIVCYRATQIQVVKLQEVRGEVLPLRQTRRRNFASIVVL